MRSIFFVGILIGTLAGVAVTALLVGAWSITGSEYSQTLHPNFAATHQATTQAASVSTPTTKPTTRPATQPQFPRVSKTKGTTRYTMDVNGVEREYWVHEPPDQKSEVSPAAVPVVIMLHGAKGNGAFAETYTGFSVLADRERFIAVYPSALGDPSRWAAGRTGTGAIIPTDIVFLEKLIAKLIAEFAADPRRIYLCGHSSGGFMTYQFAAAHPELIAAAGVSAGSIGGMTADGRPMFMITPPKIPVPLIVFHGKKDDAIAYDHSVTLGAGREKTVPVPDAIAYWVNLNRAFPAPAQKTLFDGAALVDFYRALPGGAPVVLYTLPEGTHQWPHDPKGELSATRIMWGFFKQFSRESPP